MPRSHQGNMADTGVHLTQLITESRQASMHCSCTMIASRVTPAVEEEGVDVEGAEEVRGAWGRCSLSCALLHQMVAASMAPFTEK